MRFISPSYEILPIPEPTKRMDVLKHLERVGRVCYKSEDRITDESCIKFLENIKKRKHWAMLEHYVFVMEVSDKVYSSIYNDKMILDDSAELNHLYKYINMSTHHGPAGSPINIVSGSPTAFNYLAEMYFGSIEYHGINEISKFLHARFPEIMVNVNNSGPVSDDIKFISRKELRQFPINIREIHDTMTVKFITDRGVSHELVRHRPASWAQESTRYCNYGNSGCTFIIPGWIPELEHQFIEGLTGEDIPDVMNPENPYNLDVNTKSWIHAMVSANDSYQELVNNGWNPQQARSVLPNSIKTEIIMTANLHEWYHFFDMRADKAAHPQMRELAYPLLKDANDLFPNMFFPLYKRSICNPGGI